MGIFDSDLIRPLELAENNYLQVLLTRFSLTRRGSGTELDVRFGAQTPTIWLRQVGGFPFFVSRSRQTIVLNEALRNGSPMTIHTEHNDSLKQLEKHLTDQEEDFLQGVIAYESAPLTTHYQQLEEAGVENAGPRDDG